MGSIKFWGVLVRFDEFQNPISLCCKPNRGY